MQHDIDRSLIQHKLNQPAKKPCKLCGRRWSAKYMTRDQLCTECDAKQDKMRSQKEMERRQGNELRRYKFLERKRERREGVV